MRFHKHEEERIVVHLLVELYAREEEEAIAGARGGLARRSRGHLAGRGVAAPRPLPGRDPLAATRAPPLPQAAVTVIEDRADDPLDETVCPQGRDRRPAGPRSACRSAHTTPRRWRSTSRSCCQLRALPSFERSRNRMAGPDLGQSSGRRSRAGGSRREGSSCARAARRRQPRRSSARAARRGIVIRIHGPNSSRARPRSIANAQTSSSRRRARTKRAAAARLDLTSPQAHRREAYDANRIAAHGDRQLHLDRALAGEGARARQARRVARLRIRLRDPHRRPRLADGADGLRGRDRADQARHRRDPDLLAAPRPRWRRPRRRSTSTPSGRMVLGPRRLAPGHGRELVRLEDRTSR